MFYIAPPRHPPIIHYLSLKSLDALVVLSGLETVRDRGLFFEIKSIFSGFLVGLKKETVATKKGVIPWTDPNWQGIPKNIGSD